MALVVIVDDDAAVRKVMAGYLRKENHDVQDFGTGTQAVAWLTSNSADLVVLDIMLPGTSGLDILQTLRQISDVPVIMLTALGAEADRVRGLELGADDYIVKPFSPRELVVRINNMLSRRDVAGSETLKLGPFELDGAARRLTKNGVEVELAPKEFDLVRVLMTHPGRAYTREELLAAVWASTSQWQDEATVTVHMGRVRQKTEDDASDPAHFVTVRGKGYRFDP